MLTAFSTISSTLKKAAQLTLLIATVTGCSTASTTVPAEARGDSCYAAIVVDANTGRTLFAANADASRYPASLTKMMTLYLLFEAMESGRVNRNTPIPVSAHAAAQQPTKLNLRPGQTIRAEDAILGMVTKSANDAAVAVGEYLGGSETRFAQMMTAKARQLGMRNTVFRNASGLPNMAQHSTAHDMAILGMALRQHFPREFAYFSRRSFVYRGQTIKGHNHVMEHVAGVDGIKTGYTNASGFNLVSSVNLDGRRLVAVVMGGNTFRARDAHMIQLIRKYLPEAKRGRSSDALAVARNDNDNVPQQTAKVRLPHPAAAPVPVVRGVVPVADVVGNDSAEGQGDADEPAKPAVRPRRKVAVPAAAAAAEDIDPLVTASAASAAGGWAVQIGSLPSAKQAQRVLSQAYAAGGSALGNSTASMQRFNQGRSTFYRARFTGFGSQKAAQKACTALKRKHFHCFPLVNN